MSLVGGVCLELDYQLNQRIFFFHPFLRTSDQNTRQEVGDFNWKNLKGDTYWNNKQGLVYGMVQSGKTASMISLIGLAHTAGYKLFIILVIYFNGKNI